MIQISDNEIMEIMTDYDNNNANQVRSAGALEYSLFELTAKKFMRTQYSPEVKEAINDGIMYAHDSAQELFKGINCFTLDARFILKKGLRTHGDNRLGITSAPPKHFDTALNLLEQTLGLATTYIAGGVCIGCFNTFLAPYIMDLTDKEVKQVLQSFVFEINQAFKNRGSQSMFSSINIDLVCPEFLKDQKAIGKGGVVLDKTYGEFQEEADRLERIITEVMIEGDAEDKPIFFPNMIYNVDGADLTKYPEVFKLSAKFSLPYFCSPKNNNVDYASVLGCRSELPNNWTGDPNIDCLGTGNSVYTTLSLPAVALKAQEENRDFYEVLDEYSEIIRKYNINRLDWIHKLWYEYRVADFMIQEDENGDPLYDLENATIVMGILGLNECCEILYGDNEVKEYDHAEEIVKHLRATVDTWKKEDNLRWGLFATPAENASYKLAQKMVRKYGFRKSKAQGNADAPFYTNSTHVPVNYPVDLITRIKTEGKLQPYTSAGNIENVYLGESYSTPEALRKLTERIRDLTGTFFWAFTTEYAICPECDSTFRGNITKCPFDDAETDVYSRITGYMTNTKTWNKGKQQELKERYRYEAN